MLLEVGLVAVLLEAAVARSWAAVEVAVELVLLGSVRVTSVVAVAASAEGCCLALVGLAASVVAMLLDSFVPVDVAIALAVFGHRL